MRLPHISHVAAFFCIFSKVRLLRIFPHKLVFSTAVLILFVFLLPLSIMFCYLDRLVANKMAPSMCPDPCGTRWGSWFQAVLYHISAYFHHIFGVYAVRLFFFFRKCRIKLTCLTRSAGVIHLLHTVAVLAVTGLCFLPARRHAGTGTSYGPVTVFVSVTSRCSGVSVCVCHKSVFHTGHLVTADSCNILLSVFVPANSLLVHSIMRSRLLAS